LAWIPLPISTGCSRATIAYSLGQRKRFGQSGSSWGKVSLPIIVQLLIINYIHMKESHQKEEFLTVEEAAQRLRVKPVTIYRMARAGKLPAIKFGKAWRISAKRLSEMFDSKP
jgi:excisionase family DNA binding protein